MSVIASPDKDSNAALYPPAVFWSLRALAGSELTPRDQAEAMAPRLTKRFYLNSKGKVIKEGSQRAEWFRHRRHVAYTWDEMAAILDTAAKDQHVCVVRGEYVGTKPEHDRRRKADKRTDGTGTYLPAPRAWLLLDVDSIPCPADLDHSGNPADAAAYLVSLLPAEFQGATYWYSTSSSYGTTDAPILKMHLAFLLDREIDDNDLKVWAKATNALMGTDLIDPVFLDPIQEHYMAAAPVFDRVADPVTGRRFGLHRGDFERVALVLPSADWRPTPKAKPAKKAKSADGEIDVETASNANTVEIGASMPRRVVEALERIGVEDFHKSVFWAVVEYFRARGHQAPAGPIQAVIARIIRNARSKNKIEARLADLERDIASARRKVEEERKPQTSTLPPYYPAPTEDRDAALLRQKQEIKKWFADGRLLISAKRMEEAKRRDYEVTDEFSDDIDMPDFAVPEVTPKESKRRRTIRIRDEVRAALFNDGPIPTGRRLLITGSQGSGKSRSSGEEIADVTEDAVVWWTVPTIEKADEQAGEYEAMRKPESMPVMVVRGRGQDDPVTGKKMCQRERAARRVVAAGQKVGEVLCKKCKYAGQCGYLRQFAEIQRIKKRALFLLAREYLFQPGPAPTPDMVIADETTIAPATEEIVVAAGLVRDAAESADPVVAKVLKAALASLIGDDPANPVDAAGGLDRLRDLCTVEEIDAAVVRLRSDIEAEQAEIELDGTMEDEEIVATVDASPIFGIRKLLHLLTAIRLEIDQPRNRFNAVVYDPKKTVMIGGEWVRQKSFVVWRMAKLRVAKKTPVLLLDGTGDEWLNEKVWGKIEHTHVPVARTAKVIGTTGRDYSKQSITGTDREGRPIAAKQEESAKLRSDLATLVQAVAADHGSVFVAATAKAEKALVEVLPPDTAHGHFGALRGVNAWEKSEAAIVIGREQPSPTAVENQTRAFLADEAEPLLPVSRYVRQSRCRRMADKTTTVSEVEVHPDLRVQKMLEQIREAEIVQAVDRCRPIFNVRHIWVLNSVVCDLTYDLIRSHSDLTAGGSRLERAWRFNGVIFTSPTDLSAANLNLWETATAAEEYVRRHLITVEVQNRYLIWKTTVIKFAEGFGDQSHAYRYRVAGRRGPTPTAYVSDRHSDPRAAVESLLGPLSMFEPIADETVEARIDATTVVEVRTTVVEVGDIRVEITDPWHHSIYDEIQYLPGEWWPDNDDSDLDLDPSADWAVASSVFGW